MGLRTFTVLAESTRHVRFLARLIDDHFDEFGLYVAHHHRWVTSALDNDAGERVAEEMMRMLPSVGRRQFGRWFARRQVRRLPYLFSVAPAGYPGHGLAARLTPPSRKGFPETHTLLDQAFQLRGRYPLSQV